VKESNQGLLNTKALPLIPGIPYPVWVEGGSFFLYTPGNTEFLTASVEEEWIKVQESEEREFRLTFW